ncbi:hypothetical protein J3E71DRAFT_365772 [Bipolaris maydis]|nr:hypothetical protein J3E71DRAFT_365772 [Bipolaris maydis]
MGSTYSLISICHIFCHIPCVPNIIIPRCIVHWIANDFNYSITTSRTVCVLQTFHDIRRYSLLHFVMAYQKRVNHTVIMFILLPIYSRLFLSSLGGAIRHSCIVVCLAGVPSLIFPAIHLQVSRLNIFRGFISCVIIRKIVEWLLDVGQQGDWRLEVAYFVAAGEWTTGALPEEYGRQIHDRLGEQHGNPFQPVTVIVAAIVTYFGYFRDPRFSWLALAFTFDTVISECGFTRPRNFAIDLSSPTFRI